MSGAEAEQQISYKGLGEQRSVLAPVQKANTKESLNGQGERDQ